MPNLWLFVKVVVTDSGVDKDVDDANDHARHETKTLLKMFCR